MVGSQFNSGRMPPAVYRSGVTKRVSAESPRTRGAARDVLFWHTVNDRIADGKDVGSLVDKSREHVVITGISLSYVIRHCKPQLLAALDRKVLVCILLPPRWRNPWVSLGSKDLRRDTPFEVEHTNADTIAALSAAPDWRSSGFGQRRKKYVTARRYNDSAKRNGSRLCRGCNHAEG